MYFFATFICVLSTLHSTEAFCERRYKSPYWTPKSLTQRAAEADIVIYGNVTESPCVKPNITYRPVFTTASPVGNATNSSSSVQQPTPSLNITEGNTTDICLSRGLYNVSLKVQCVIKGGSVPRVIHLRALGFGRDMCLYYDRAYMETVHSFHVYKGLTYLIFLGRHEAGGSDPYGFWPHSVNMQFAAQEITDLRLLQPIFAASGGHAHHPAGILANETDSTCKPHTAGAGTNYVNFFALVVLLCGLTLI